MHKVLWCKGFQAQKLRRGKTPFCFIPFKILLSYIEYTIATYEPLKLCYPRTKSQILIWSLNYLSNTLLKEACRYLAVKHLLPPMAFSFRNFYNTFKFWKEYTMRCLSIYILHIAEWCSPQQFLTHHSVPVLWTEGHWNQSIIMRQQYQILNFSLLNHSKWKL